jgi:uncharacterized membrane protein YphA (DoxX/SURF4 family)
MRGQFDGENPRPRAVSSQEGRTMSFSKTRSIGYWATTGIVALDFFVGGAANLARPAAVVAAVEHLGYPSYFALILGGWKVLGALALLAPRFPRLKEWAYAGIFFDLTGAAFSHVASGDRVGDVLAPLIFAAVAAASWALRPQSRTLGVLSHAPRRALATGERLQTA